MLKPQDCVVLIKLLANPEIQWSQRQLAKCLYISLSEINGGINRLSKAGLLRKDRKGVIFLNLNAVQEFLISGIKFFFPGKLGEYTRGIPTAIGAPLFHDKIALNKDPIPVWPDALGEKKGVALVPIYPSVTKALREYPDPAFYELLVLVDVIRSGRARERNMAVNLLHKRIGHVKQ